MRLIKELIEIIKLSTIKIKLHHYYKKLMEIIARSTIDYIPIL